MRIRWIEDAEVHRMCSSTAVHASRPSPEKQLESMRKEAVEPAVMRSNGFWCRTDSRLPTAAPVKPAQQKEGGGAGRETGV